MVPIIGVKDPVTSKTALAADYKHVQSSCVSTVCTLSHGTFRIKAGDAWTSCRDGNLAVGACTGAAANDTLESRGSGQWRVKSADGTDIGTAMAFNPAGQNVLIVDLKVRRAGGFGIGMLIGGQQVAMTTTMTDGTWVAATGSGHWFLFKASGSAIAISQVDWQPVKLDTTFAANAPWTGMATTAWGEVGFFAGSGV